MDQGYAVIYLHRRGCKRPFLRHTLDSIEALASSGPQSNDPTSQQLLSDPLSALSLFQRMMGGTLSFMRYSSGSYETGMPNRSSSRSENGKVEKTTPPPPPPLPPAYIEVPYTTINDYLFSLREVSASLRPAGRSAMLLLAAAVSDFYVPERMMAEHKIQSGFGEPAEGGLTIQLSPVPKALGVIKASWCPDAAVVSFKLETEPSLLIPKAVAAVDRYGVDGVVANLLDKRYKEVLVVRAAPAAGDGAAAAVGDSIGASSSAAASSASSSALSNTDRLFQEYAEPSHALPMENCSSAFGIPPQIVAAYTGHRRLTVPLDGLPDSTNGNRINSSVLRGRSSDSGRKRDALVTIIRAPPSVVPQPSLSSQSSPSAGSSSGGGGDLASRWAHSLISDVIGATLATIANGGSPPPSAWDRLERLVGTGSSDTGSGSNDAVSPSVSSSAPSAPSAPSLVSSSSFNGGSEVLEDMLACALIGLHSQHIAAAAPSTASES